MDPTIWQRLAGRNSGVSLEWHRRREIELTELMERRQIGHSVVDTEGKSTAEVAGEVNE